MSSSKSYIANHLELMKEWDWEKNNLLGLYPDKLTSGSHKKVWWKCVNGHSWDAEIKSRVSGSRCRFCTGQAVTEERSLATKFPELIKEWDYKKNYPLTPNDVSSGTNKVVYWKCSICKQVYSQSVYSRTKRLTKKSPKCPVCLGVQIIPNYNSLKAKYPEVAKEWDYKRNAPIKPENIAPHTNKEYYWLCGNGHSYLATPNNKIRGKAKCPECYLATNNLAVVNPELAAQWHPIKNNKAPDEVTFGCNDSAHWLCPICNHEWQAKINNRNNGRGCPECSKGQHTSFPEQAIYYYVKQLFPDAINQYKFNGVEIDVFIPSVNIGIEYDGSGLYHGTSLKHDKDIRKNEFLFEQGVNLIRVRDTDCYPMEEELCKIFLIKHTSTYENLQPTIEQLLLYISQITGVYQVINVDIKSIKNPILKDIHTVKFEDSFAYYATVNSSKIKALWDYDKNSPLTPEMVTPMSSREVSWICKNDSTHKWDAPVSSISSGYGYRHQYTTEEWIEKAREVHGDRYDYSKANYINSETPITIICKTHGEFTPLPPDHLAGKNCKWCKGQGGYHPLHTLAVVRPDLAKEWDFEHPENKGLTPDDVVVTDNTNEYWWRCNKGKPHSYSAKISYRIKQNSGCSVCHGKQVSDDTSLEALRPDLVKEWHESNILKPSEVSLGSEREVVWKCSNPDHPTYKLRIDQRVKLKYGCHYCSGRKILPADFAKKVTERFAHIILLTEYQKSSIKIEYQCTKCGYVDKGLPNNILKKKFGCSNCKDSK